MKTFQVSNLNDNQKRLLQDFFTHCKCVAKYGEKAMFDLWAGILDKAQIGWNLQNGTAYLANQAGKMYLSFGELKEYDR